MSYKLLWPYTQEERAIFEEEHAGMIFALCPKFLCALEEWETLYNDEIKGDEETWRKEKRIKEILDRLDEIDLKSIRALRANDTEYIEMYEEEAIALREELAELRDKEIEE